MMSFPYFNATGSTDTFVSVSQCGALASLFRRFTPRRHTYTVPSKYKKLAPKIRGYTDNFTVYILSLIELNT